MNRAALLIAIGVALAVGMVLLNYGLTYVQWVYDAFAYTPRDLAALREDPVERVWMLQSAVWTGVFALSIVAVLGYLYYLSKE